MSDTFIAPLEGATAGRLLFAREAAHVALHGDPVLPALCHARFDGPSLAARAEDGTVTIAYPDRFHPLDWRRHAATVTLNATIPWHIEVIGSVAHLAADLTALRLVAVEVGDSASRVELALPRPAGAVPLRFGGSVSHLVVRRPVGVPVRLHITGAASGLTLDGRRLGAVGGELRWESPDSQGAADRYDLEIGGSATRVTVTTT
jgi:hypothetical protein